MGGMGAKRFTSAQSQAVRAAYEAGARVGDLVREYDACWTSVIRMIHRAGGVYQPNYSHRRLRKFSNEECAELRAWSEAGASLRELAAATGSSESTINLAILRAGVSAVKNDKICRRAFTQSEVAGMIQCRQKGVCVRDIAAMYCTTRKAVQRIFVDRKVKRPLIIPPENFRAIKVQYYSGVSVVDLAEQYGCSTGKIYRVIRTPREEGG